MTTGEKVVMMYELQESLKPCPFCGSKPIIRRIEYSAFTSKGIRACIFCLCCDMEADFTQDVASSCAFKRLLPWEQWNTRAEVQNG